MFENKAKGWFGSYSKVGRDSAEKYPMIMQKDKILANQYKKYKIKDYFTTEDDIDIEKTMMDYGEDIFSQTYQRKIERRQKFKNVCALKTEDAMSADYKYHEIHHKGLYDFNLIIKGQRKYQTSSSVNLPKDDLTTKRIITGPEWMLLSGRKNKLWNIKDLDIDFYNTEKIDKKKHKIFEMVKQTQRGNLPTSYDLRIRIEEPYDKGKNLKKNNKISPIKVTKTQIIDGPYIDKFPMDFNEKKENHSLSFAKNMSREKYYFLTRDRNEIRPFFTPNYKFVEPRSITTVSYNQKNSKRPPLKRKIGIQSNLLFDPLKSINKVNNNKSGNAPDLRLMEGRESEDNKNEEIRLPAHMNKVHDRNSLEVVTKKALQMNNYINGEMKNYFSSFNKKSFNSIINYNLLKNGNGDENLKLIKISKKMNVNEKIKGLMEFYSKNLDDENKLFSLKKIDGITFKSFNKKIKLNDKENKLFNLRFYYQ